MPTEDPRWIEANRLLEKAIPDARPRDPWLRSRRESVDRNGRRAERVYCINCGTDGGAVSIGWALHVIYLCEKCAETIGQLPLPEIPEDLLIRDPQ